MTGGGWPTPCERKDVTDMTGGGWPTPCECDRKDITDMTGEGWPTPCDRRDITAMTGWVNDENSSISYE